MFPSMEVLELMKLRLSKAARRVLEVSDEVLELLSEDLRGKMSRPDLDDDEKLKILLWGLYWGRGLSSSQIARLLGLDSRLVRRMMARLNVERRGRIEALRMRLTKYAKKPFTGSASERVRVHTLVICDAHARLHRSQVEVTTTTPNPWLIRVVHELLGPYSEHFRLDPVRNKDTGYFEWRVGILLDMSFKFLLEPVKVDLDDDDQFWAFMASLIDSEGTIKLSRRGDDGVRVCIEVSNEDEHIARLAMSGLRARGFNARLFINEDAGARTNLGVLSRPCYVVGIYEELHVMRLLEELIPLLGHYERRTYMTLALRALNHGLPWSRLMLEKSMLDEVFGALIEYSRAKAKEEFLRRQALRAGGGLRMAGG